MVPRVAAPLNAPDVYRFQSRLGEHVLLVPFTAIYDLPNGTDDAEGLIRAALLDGPPIDPPLDQIAEPAPQSISLNVSNRCNLSCAYCYASRGDFGGAQDTSMTPELARAAVDRLFTGASHDSPVTIGFLGGEPFANRKVIHDTVAYATSEGTRRGFDVRFSVTTNGTLLREDDIALLRRHPFAVTVSIDGPPARHDMQRPRARTGLGSWSLLAQRIKPILTCPGGAKLAARATVTRDDLNIAARIEAITGLGFPEVGVSPLRSAAKAGSALRDADWPIYFDRLTEAANIELDRIRNGLPIRLTNLAVALKQLHRGAVSPYPCGAGGGYFSVAADGRWYACHRAIGDEEFLLGNNAGLDVDRRRAFLSARHVHRQESCGECWARYLCSGACHQEMRERTRASCDFIRAWLDFCLRTYCELSISLPTSAQRGTG